ncbi:MAG: hypothetical protein IOD11_20675 [Rhodocyclaceae bacterium]|nr:hypothetical protein [Rhodocyclaceae bacterium]MCA3097452.1 hypothetical protein [Rhodocyclaceae bacterium]MCA3120491.1 hypothetical protein [Rhodocyclaceae bacterium]
MSDPIKLPEPLQLADALSGVMYSADHVVKAAALLRTQHAQLLEWEAKATTWLLSPEAATRLDGYRELGARVAKAEAKVERLRAELARLTTLRPASEWDGETYVLWWREWDEAGWVIDSVSDSQQSDYWTPAFDAKGSA